MHERPAPAPAAWWSSAKSVWIVCKRWLIAVSHPKRPKELAFHFEGVTVVVDPPSDLQVPRVGCQSERGVTEDLFFVRGRNKSDPLSTLSLRG
jgi:hypothetical protein